MACKLRKEPRPCRCVQRDDLAPVLERLHAAEAVILGSPIYFSEITGEMRSFFERFLFQSLELARRFNPSEQDIEKEIQMAGARVQVLCLVPEHITGKRVHEA